MILGCDERAFDQRRQAKNAMGSCKDDWTNRTMPGLNSGLKEKIIKGSLQSMLVRSAGLGLGFVSTVLLSQNLGGTEFGRYAIFLSWSLILVVPIKLGYDHTVLKFASGYWAAGEHANINGMAVFGMRAVILTTVITSVLCFSVYLAIPKIFNEATPSDIIMVLMLSSTLAIIGIYSQFFRAAEKIIFSQFFEQVLRSAILIIFILMWAYIGLNQTSRSSLIMTIGAAIFALGFLIIFFWLYVWCAKKGVGWQTQDQEKWMSVSWPMFGATFAGQVLSQMGVIILGVVASSADAGHFAIISRLAAFVTFALVALNSITAPLIASAFKRKDFEELRKISTLNARLSTIVGLIVCCTLAAFGYPILGLFGSEFQVAYVALIVLLIGTVFGAATGPVGYLLSMTNQQSFFFYNSVACAILTLTMMVLLIYPFGVIGAAIAASGGQIYQNLSRWIVVRNRLRIDASFLGLPIRSAGSFEKE